MDKDNRGLKPLLEIKEVLPVLQCSENTFRTWIKRNKLPDGLIMRIGNTQRVRANILTKWINGELE